MRVFVFLMLFSLFALAEKDSATIEPAKVEVVKTEVETVTDEVVEKVDSTTEEAASITEEKVDSKSDDNTKPEVVDSKPVEPMVENSEAVEESNRGIAERNSKSLAIYFALLMGVLFFVFLIASFIPHKSIKSD